MSDASASILPRKIGNPGPNRAKSGFTPDMLRAFCDLASDSLGELLDARVKVSLDSVGLEPMGDLMPGEGATICGAVVDLNGIERAATFMPDAAAQFHLIDIMLGADASTSEPVVDGPPSPLGDRFCRIATEAVMHALVAACDAGIGPGACVYAGRIDIVHDRELLTIAPPKADVLAIDLTVGFGKSDRAGRFSMHVPLKTVDTISGAAPGGSAQPAYESGPWFDHMKSSVAMMELDAVALLKTERMTLAALSRLDIGDVIALDRDSVTAVTIVLEDGGDLIATGELGTTSGKRVISLDSAPSEGFLEPVRKLLENE